MWRERLHPERNAGHARRSVGTQEPDGDVLRIALDGHLGSLLAADGPEQPGELASGELRGSSTADEDRGRGAEAFVVGTMKLGQARVDVGLREVVQTRPRGEGAVVTAACAERYVQVHAERVPGTGAGLTHEASRALPAVSGGS